MEIVASVLLLLGALLALIATTGLHRFPDVFARMHAATKPATLGLALTLLGTAFVIPSPGAVAKLMAVIIFQFLTAPVGAHLVGRATFRAGTELDPATTFDDLAEQLRSKF
ncbi:MAG: monovalent cation/H(+) antiporter subunit G [Actinomycetota bacterium]